MKDMFYNGNDNTSDLYKFGDNTVYDKLHKFT